MDKRITVADCPVNIHSRTADDSFRIEITPLTDSGKTVNNQIFERAQNWSVRLRGSNANASLRCFRDGTATVIEDLRAPLTSTDINDLAEYLTTGEMTGEAMAGSSA